MVWMIWTQWISEFRGTNLPKTIYSDVTCSFRNKFPCLWTDIYLFSYQKATTQQSAPVSQHDWQHSTFLATASLKVTTDKRTKLRDNESNTWIDIFHSTTLLQKHRIIWHKFVEAWNKHEITNIMDTLMLSLTNITIINFHPNTHKLWWGEDPQV